MNNSTATSPTGLPLIFQPQVVTITIDDAINELISRVQNELIEFANKDSNKCWGYFPALKEKNIGLGAAKEFHDHMPTIVQSGNTLELNFIRLSLIQQTGDSPYHMDSDSKTAITGDTSTIGSRLVWRLLLNLSSAHPRTLGYLDLDTTKIELTTEGGYIHYTGDTNDYEQGVTLPPRTNSKISGVLFCASRVLHTGKDDSNGHFVAGYGFEEPA